MITSPAELEIDTKPVFDVSESAVKHGKLRLLDAGKPVLGLRVGIRGGGCSGYSYVFDFAEGVRPNKDLVYQFGDLRVVVDKKSLKFLEGATLTWETRLMGYGFKWDNPNADSDCGCGESFSVRS